MNMKLAATFLSAALLPASAFAWEHNRADIKVLTESASALSSTNPDLSRRLEDLAARESTETESNEEHGAVQKQDVQLLRDSASALRATRPDLARGLESFASQESGEQREGGRQGATQEGGMQEGGMPEGGSQEGAPGGMENPPSQPSQQQPPHGGY